MKLYSSHLLAMAIFLALPDAQRLVDFFVRNRPVEPARVDVRFSGRPSRGARHADVVRARHYADTALLLVPQRQQFLQRGDSAITG